MESEDAHIEGWNRFFAHAVRTWAESRGVTYEFSFGDWLIRLEKDGVVKYIEWCDIGLNTSAQHLVAKDKSATSHILEREGIPHVEHTLVLRPQSKGWLPQQAQLVQEFFAQHNNDVVIKPNTGAGGTEVVRATTYNEGVSILEKLFLTHRALALSPFVVCVSEYRVTVLDTEVLHMYEKRHAPDPTEFRFNLAHGATAHEVPQNDWEAVAVLARAAQHALGGRFMNIDIVRLSDGTMRVMEINGSVAFEKYVLTSDEAEARALESYARALDALFT